MSNVATEFGCPTCRDAGVTSQIIASGGNSLVCSTNSTHRWVDRLEFVQLRPAMAFTVSAPPPTQQTGHTKIQVSLPIGHAQTLAAKLGPKLEPTVAGILSMLAEGEVMILPAGDLQRIKQILGKMPDSSSELFGMIYALDLREKEAKSDVEQARKEVAAYEGRNREFVLLDIGGFRDAIEKRAQDDSLPVKLYLERFLKNAVENSWL
jgi:hypothetical protein